MDCLYIYYCIYIYIYIYMHSINTYMVESLHSAQVAFALERFIDGSGIREVQQFHLGFGQRLQKTIGKP